MRQLRLYPATEVLILTRHGRRFRLLNQQGKTSYDLSRRQLRGLFQQWENRQGPFVMWARALRKGRRTGR